MSRTIYEYTLELVDTQSIDMHPGAEPISVQAQSGWIRIWAIVGTDLSQDIRQVRQFTIVGTGKPLPDRILKFIGTVQLDGYGWHVFEG